MTEYENFKQECSENILRQGNDAKAKELSQAWISNPLLAKYSYNFEWMGRPIIQFPQDILMLQELIWQIKPDLIIETGIAHGGSLIFHASMLELNALASGNNVATVLGIDIDIRQHNKTAILNHPLAKRIKMLEGSSTSPEIIAKVYDFAKAYQSIMVILDSNHTHAHVLAELEAYAKLTSINSYCIVFDTIIEYMPNTAYPDRPWRQGNNPKTAIAEFMINNKNFIEDAQIDAKLLISTCPGGYLKRIA